MKYILATTALALSVSCATSAFAEKEQVGEATRTKTSVKGDAGEISVKGPIHRNERIQTSKLGLGEFKFRDGTKLAVGWGSSIVVDKFVFDDSVTFKKLTVKAAKGTFRWVSGKSKSQAYEIITPAGTVGVRGTRFDFYVAPDGTTAVVLLGGAATFCGSGSCVQLRRTCDAVIARPGQAPEFSRAGRQTLGKLGNMKALPFMSGTQTLSGGFGARATCGMSIAQQTENPDTKTQNTNGVDPSEATVTRPTDRPDKSVKSDKPTKPDKPTTPDKPDVGKPDKPGIPDPGVPSPEPGTPDVDKPDPGNPGTNPGTGPTQEGPTPENPGTPPTKPGHGYGDKNHHHQHQHEGGEGGQGGEGGGKEHRD